MKVDNRTHYDTTNIRRILQACCQESDYTPPAGATVRVVYSRWRGCSGWATYGAVPAWSDKEGAAMLLRVPRKWTCDVSAVEGVFLESFIFVVRHEVGHWRGLKHAQMAGGLLRRAKFKLSDHPWAAELTLGAAQKATPVKALPKDRSAVREARARKMLLAHEGKLAREKRLVAKWQARVRYYDKKRAAEAAAQGAELKAAMKSEESYR